MWLARSNVDTVRRSVVPDFDDIVEFGDAQLRGDV
jgi:hypothetical protein